MFEYDFERNTIDIDGYCLGSGTGTYDGINGTIYKTSSKLSESSYEYQELQDAIENACGDLIDEAKIKIVTTQAQYAPEQIRTAIFVPDKCSTKLRFLLGNA